MLAPHSSPIRALFLALLSSSAAAPVAASGTYGAQAAENASSLLSRLLIQEVAAAEGVAVVSKRELQQVLEAEATRVVGGCDDTSCMMAVAGQLGSRFVVYGEVARVDTTLNLALTLFDTDEGSSAARERVRGETLTELARALPAATKTLVEGLRARAGDTPAAGSPARVLVLDIKASASSFPPPRGGMPPLQASVMQTIGGAGVATLAMAPVGALAATTFFVAPAAPVVVGAGLLAALLAATACSPLLCPVWSVAGAVAGVFAGDYLGHLDGSLWLPALAAGLLWFPLVLAPLAGALIGAYFVPFTEDGSGLLATVGIAGLGVVVAVLGLIAVQAAGVAVYHLTAEPAPAANSEAHKVAAVRGEIPPALGAPSVAIRF